MGVKQYFILAMKSISTSKMRSFLTMLGIIIGVASVIILVSLVGGFAGSLTSTFEGMGTNLITVNIPGRGSSRQISPEDMQAFVDECPDYMTEISPIVNMSPTVKNGNLNTETTAYGVNEFYADIRSIELSSGRFLRYIDVEKRLHVAVIGGYIAKTLFPSGDPVGQSIKVNGSMFTVVGVLKTTAENEEDSDDDRIIIPYTAAMRLSSNANASSYTVMAKSTDTVETAMVLLKAKLYSVFGDENSYRVSSATEMLDRINELMGTLTLVLVGIAAISLLVGGIGIMNIMLVSVSERTREIGIRKSLGAKKRNIMGQFVVEAATTSALGGVAGILLGSAAAVVTGSLIGLSVTPTFTAIAVSFSVSVAIGITFGYFPARKAASLNPIDALRSE